VAGQVPCVPFFAQVAFKSPMEYVPMSDSMDAHGVSRKSGSHDGSIPDGAADAALQSELMESPSPSPCGRNTSATYDIVSLKPAQ